MQLAARRAHSDLATVRAFVDRHYATPLTIDQLATRARLSPFHFIRAFRTAYGETPHQYLRRKRVERAKELLVTTPIAITELCDQIGFQSLGSFSTLFRRLTGETPANAARPAARTFTFQAGSSECSAPPAEIAGGGPAISEKRPRARPAKVRRYVHAMDHVQGACWGPARSRWTIAARRTTN